MITPVFCRIDGKLARFHVETDNHAQAIWAVKTELSKRRTPAQGAVPAVIEGGKQ